MTDGARPKRIRWPRAHIRALAWVAGAATFFTGVAVLGSVPRPAADATNKNAVAPPRRVVIRHVIKKIIVISPSKPTYSAPVSYSGGGTTVTHAAPPPAPTSTGGSHP
jgi:hypothetical protein